MMTGKKIAKSMEHPGMQLFVLIRSVKKHKVSAKH